MSRSKLRDKWMRKLYAKRLKWVAAGFVQIEERNPHRVDEMPKNRPSRYVTTHCKASVNWLQESTSFGGHSIPKGGHRRVSGLVRASVRREIRGQIDMEINGGD